MTKENEPSKCASADERCDFYGISGVDKVNHYLKPGDCLPLAAQLLATNCFQLAGLVQQAQDKKSDARSPVVRILDIGGADGLMMLKLLKMLDICASIFLVETNKDRVAAYKERAKQHPSFMTVFGSSSKSIDGIARGELPRVDMILASHVMYYNRDAWLSCDSIRDHFFTSLLLSLNPNGVLSFILQSCRAGEPGCHEFFEDFAYHLIEKTKHGKNRYHATAEQLSSALSNFNKQFIVETGHPVCWKIRQETNAVKIPLGDINFTKNEKGFYLQNENVLSVLKFYLKGADFQQLTSDKQEIILDFIKKNFYHGNEFVVTHYNKILTIEMNPALYDLLHHHFGNDQASPKFMAKL